MKYDVPFSSPEARSRAAEALDAGRLSVRGGEPGSTVAAATPVEELLFNVGRHREQLRLEVEAGHAAIPEDLVSREKDRTDERSVAQRVRLLLELVSRRAAVLLAPTAPARVGLLVIPCDRVPPGEIHFACPDGHTEYFLYDGPIPEGMK